ncbi:unnamed protein product, partial [Pylaiella littoralis]
ESESEEEEWFRCIVRSRRDGALDDEKRTNRQREEREMALCESWDSNWMGGSSCAGFDDDDLDNDNLGNADAFEAGLEPLPTWDGAAYSSPTSSNKNGGGSTRRHAAPERHRRQHKWAKGDNSLFPVGDEDKALYSLNLAALSLGPDEIDGYTGADSPVLRASKLAGNSNVMVERPVQLRSRPSQAEETLTHVIRLHRTGSVVVECKGGLRPPGDVAARQEAGPVEAGKEEAGHGYYAEEERFWKERCPNLARTDVLSTGALEGTRANASVVVVPRANSPAGIQAAAAAAAAVSPAGRANYDYSTAEAAYRSSSPRHRKSRDHPDRPRTLSDDDDEQAGGEKGGRTRQRRRTKASFEEGGGDDDGGSLNNSANSNGKLEPHQRSPPPPPPPPPRQRVVCGSEAWKQGDTAARRQRFRSLRDAETVLHGVLESVKGGLAKEDDYRGVATMAEDSSALRSTLQEKRVSALRQRVAEVFRGQTTLPAGNHDDVGDRGSLGRISPNRTKRVHGRHHHPVGNSSGGGTHDHGRGIDGHAPSPPSASSSPGREQPPPLGARDRSCSSSRGGGTAAVAGGAGSHHRHQRRPCQQGEEGEEEEESVGRVAEMSRRIALRCLDMEQECLRRERSQTRLFQEQLRGVRQAAQELTLRTIRDEKARTSDLLKETQKRFEEREKEAAVKFEQAEENWRAEKGALSASLADAKSESERTRRLAREAGESGRKDAEAALERQSQELQRRFAEQKGGLRRAAEETLRRVVDGKARDDEEAALQAQTIQESLSAQVRSWKAKAESAERRAAEERDKRRGLEAGAKGALAQASGEVEKTRQVQEGALRELRTKSEADRAAHMEEVERLKEEHRANLLRVHQDKKKTSEAARQQWLGEIQEVRSEAAAKAEEAATRAVAERAEALRRLRLAHDVEMRKAGRDILRLERESRRYRQQQEQQEQQEPSGVLARSKLDSSPLSPLPVGSYSPKPL